jgi:hypothetical protein
MERHAWEEREARLSIVEDAGVDGGLQGGLGEGFRGNPALLFGPASRAAPARPILPIAKLQFLPRFPHEIRIVQLRLGTNLFAPKFMPITIRIS